MADLNTPQTELIKRKMIEASLTLLETQNQLIPLKSLDTLTVACVSVGQSAPTPFQNMLGKYMKTAQFNLPETFSGKDLDSLKLQLKEYNLVIVGIHLYESKTRRSMQVGNMQRIKDPRPYGMTAQTEELLGWLAAEKKTIEVFFSSPYALPEVKNFRKPDALIMAYQNDSLNQELAAQLIFGGIGASGKLPVSLGTHYAVGDGLSIDKPIRLKYTIPEEAGLNSVRLNNRIDSIVNGRVSKKHSGMQRPGGQRREGHFQENLWLPHLRSNQSGNRR
jgi:hypothetical protein